MAKHKPIAAIISDTHVAPMSIARVGSSGDSMESVRQFVAFVRHNQIKDTVWLGDLNTRVSNRSFVHSFWIQMMDELAGDKIRFHFIQGNHDADDPPYFSGFADANPIHRQEFQFGPLKCYGIDFQPQENLIDELAQVPDNTHILFTHQGWKEWMGFAGSYQGSFADVPDGIDTIISGDNHKHYFGYRPRSGDDYPLVCYSPGSSAMTSIAEDPEKYFLVITSDGKTTAINRQPLKTRRVLCLGRIDTNAQLDQLLAALPKQISLCTGAAAADELPEELWKPYVRISYYHRLQDLPRRVISLVKGSAYLFWDELRPQEEESRRDSIIVPAMDDITPLRCLDQEVDPIEKPRVNALLRRVLSAIDPQKEFDTWQREFLAED